MTRHPDDRALLAWLDGADDGRVGEHAAACDECADRCDRLVPSVDWLPAMLRDELGGDDDLEMRMLDRIGDALTRRAALETFTSLFGVGFEVTGIVFDEEDRS